MPRSDLPFQVWKPDYRAASGWILVSKTRYIKDARLILNTLPTGYILRGNKILETKGKIF